MEFDDIRSYHDHEVNQVLARLIKEPAFIKAVHHIFGPLPQAHIEQMFNGITGIRQFQARVIYDTMQRISSTTTKGVNFEGLENISKDKACLFITNHRDIVLDSAFLNSLLFENGFETTEIAIGDNLLIFPWITDLVKLNRSFVVKRSLTRDNVVAETHKLSSYIRSRILDYNVSVWIAQKEGRTKNGDDRTNPALLKMMDMSGTSSLVANFRELNIVPVSISYEFEPCDGHKVKEAVSPGYKKTVQDDLNSMFAGIFDPKGKVVFSIGKPINDQIDVLNESKNKNDQLKLLAQTIDQQIHLNYKLFPNNFIAYDLKHQSDEFTTHYSPEQKAQFVTHMNHKFDTLNITEPQRETLFLDIYANPVKNKLRMVNEV